MSLAVGVSYPNHRENPVKNGQQLQLIPTKIWQKFSSQKSAKIGTFVTSTMWPEVTGSGSGRASTYQLGLQRFPGLAPDCRNIFVAFSNFLTTAGLENP